MDVVFSQLEKLLLKANYMKLDIYYYILTLNTGLRQSFILL